MKWSEVVQSCPTLCDLVDCSPPGSSPSMEFSRQEYWSGLPFPSPGDLPDPGIEPGSPALQADALTSQPPGKPHMYKEPSKLNTQSSRKQAKEMKCHWRGYTNDKHTKRYLILLAITHLSKWLNTSNLINIYNTKCYQACRENRITHMLLVGM